MLKLSPGFTTFSGGSPRLEARPTAVVPGNIRIVETALRASRKVVVDSAGRFMSAALSP